MSTLEIYLVAVFAAVWLLPVGLAVRWEIRKRRLSQRIVGLHGQAGRTE